MKTTHSIIDNLPAWRPMRRVSPTCCATCIGGRACCLNARVRHTLHTCDNPSCACHQTYREHFMHRGAHS